MLTRKVQIDEVMVRPMPQSLREKGPCRQTTAWYKRMAKWYTVKLRQRILEEHGIDILQVTPMSDCVEIRLRGEIECQVIEKKTFKRMLTPDQVRLIRENDWDQVGVWMHLGVHINYMSLKNLKERRSYKDVD